MQFALADYHQALEIDPMDENIRSRIAIIHNEYGIAISDFPIRRGATAKNMFICAEWTLVIAAGN